MQQLFPTNTFVNPRLVNGNRIMVAEAPGEQEQLEGEPLVGGSGRILRGLRVKNERTGEYIRYGGLIGEAGLRDSEISYINTIQCRPPENIYPTDSKAKDYISREDGERSIQHCLSRHVIPVLKSRQWTRIDLIGGKALKYLGEKKEGVEGWRGSPISIPAVDPNRFNACATIHPAALMRDQSMMVAVVNDLKKSLVQPPEKYILHPTLEQVKAFDAEIFAFDIETNYPRTRDITMVGLSATPYEVIVVPWINAFISELKRIFKNAKAVIGQNVLQFDLPYLRDYDVVLAGRDVLIYDIMLMQHLVMPDQPHDLTYIGSIFTSKPTWEFDRHQDEALYNARDVDVTIQAWKQLKTLLPLHKLEDIYDYVQVPLAKICYDMKQRGICIDASRIGEIRAKLKSEANNLEGNLPEILRTQLVDVRKRVPAPPGTMSEPKYGKKGKLLKQRPIKHLFVIEKEEIIPWRSPTKIAEYLYETCKLPVERDLKTESISTGKIALAKIARRLQNRTYRPEGAEAIHQAVQAIQRLRQIDELSGNFTQDEYTKVKKLHTSFNVHGTASGRLSSSNPNLQNVPMSARYIYVPSQEGWSIVSIDYSGIENRITAYLAGDVERLARFDSRPGFSEHKYAVELFYDIPYNDVQKDNDRTTPYGRCKAIVHGCDRGEGARKIALLNDIPEAEIRPIWNKWRATISETVKWQSSIGAEAAKNGYLVNPFGRKAWFGGSRAYTQAISFMPQSTAADVIFRAMIGLMYERIDWPLEKVQKIVGRYEPLPEYARMLLQVHDELVFECETSKVESLVKILKNVLEQPWPELGGMILPTKAAAGRSWAEVEDL